MCYAELIAGTAALVGTGLSVAGSAKSQNAMNDAAKAELYRQGRYQQQAAPLFAQSLARSTAGSAQGNISQGEVNAQTAINKVGAVPMQQAPVAGLTGTGEQGARAGITNAAAAGNMGYSEYALQQAINNLLTRQRLGLVSNLSGSSAGLAGLDIAHGAQSGASLQGVGSLLGTAGYLGGLYGASRPPKSTQNAYNNPGIARSNPIFKVY